MPRILFHSRGNFNTEIQQSMIAFSELNRFFKQMPETKVSFFKMKVILVHICMLPLPLQCASRAPARQVHCVCMLPVEEK